jgi:hypothetical protein
MPHPQIKFGTDGWRGVIADDFTFANVRVAAEAIAAYVHAKEDPAKWLCIGYDTRFGSKAFAHTCAEVVAATGIAVRLANDITPTPALSYGVRALGAAGGIMMALNTRLGMADQANLRSSPRLSRTWISLCPNPRSRQRSRKSTSCPRISRRSRASQTST